MPASRVRRHIFLAAGSLAILVTAWFIGERSAALDRISMVSAYMFLLSLSLVLLIGPWRAVRTGRSTMNHVLRRDVAIWSAISGLVHLIAGAVQSMTPDYLAVFVTATNRQAVFLWSTVIGFVIGALLIVLLSLSSNWSIAVIGQRRWKRLHRLSYIVFALTLLHGFGFQWLESRFWPGYVLLFVILLGVCIAQIIGIRAVRR